MNGVNLIPVPRILARRRKLRLRRWAWALAAYVLALGVTHGWMYARWGRRPQDWDARLAQVENQIRATNDTLALRRAALTEAEATLRANRAVGAQPDWSMLLGLLGRKVGEEVVLESIALRPSEATGAAAGAKAGTPGLPVLALSGLGKTHAAISAFVLELERTGVFSRVTLLETRRMALPRGEGIGFRVEAALNSTRRGP